MLGDIPVLGYAFQERRNERTKRNLLVFVTPTIIKQGYGTGLEDQVSGLKNSGEEFADPNGWRNNAKGAVRIVPTSNRQTAVKAIAARCEALYVIGAPNSSNSLRLVEVAEREGTRARLIQRADEIDFDWIGDVATLGLTAGASAPEVLVREVVDAIAARFDVTEEQVETARESIAFKLPRGLEAA